MVLYSTVPVPPSCGCVSVHCPSIEAHSCVCGAWPPKKASSTRHPHRGVSRRDQPILPLRQGYHACLPYRPLSTLRPTTLTMTGPSRQVGGLGQKNIGPVGPVSKNSTDLRPSCQGHQAYIISIYPRSISLLSVSLSCRLRHLCPRHLSFLSTARTLRSQGHESHPTFHVFEMNVSPSMKTVKLERVSKLLGVSIIVFISST